MRRSFAGMSVPALRTALALFFLALALPIAVLVQQTYGRLRWEAFHQHQLLAEELAARIDGQLRQWVAAEEARPFTDYAFLTVAGDPAANFLQRSPLSAFPPEPALPGLIGYFQVDADGAFSTPLLPPSGTEAARVGIPPAELDARRTLADRIRQVLGENRLVRRPERAPAAAETMAAPPRPAPRMEKDAALPALAEAPAAPPAPEDAGQALFDQLNRTAPAREKRAAGSLGKVEALQLAPQIQGAAPDEERKSKEVRRQAAEPRMARREQSALPAPAEAGLSGRAAADAAAQGPIHTFESEVDPFEFSRLDSGQFVLFRKVWRDGRRYIQGLLLERQPFLRGLVAGAFDDTTLSRMSDLVVAYRGDIFLTLQAQEGDAYSVRPDELRGTLLYQTRLSAPLGDLELLFSIRRLPAGPGAALVNGTAALLAIVLAGGFLLLYRLGVGQIRLARQQQDFVSAVSHELKTPLTSIRMYGEILREGWAPEPKRQEYYRFIHDESERLSRLINNVLQLARMTRNDLKVALAPAAAGELLDEVRSKVSAQVEQAGFTLTLACDGAAAGERVAVDRDYFTQILINLVDNGLKFSAGAARHEIHIGCRQVRDGIQFSVRDYGPGVPRNQMRKIFRLFYRSGNELTRETVGTGIGLALVRQLTEAMGGRVDVVNLDPGAEFQVTFKAVVRVGSA